MEGALENLLHMLGNQEQLEEALTTLYIVLTEKKKSSHSANYSSSWAKLKNALLIVLKNEQACLFPYPSGHDRHCGDGKGNKNDEQTNYAESSTTDLYNSILALSCLYYICDGLSWATLTKEDMDILIKYIVPKTGNRLFQYCESYKTSMESVLSICNGDVSVTVDQDSKTSRDWLSSVVLVQDWESDLKYYEADVYEILKQRDSLSVERCEVFLPSDSSDRTCLSDELTNLRVAWPRDKTNGHTTTTDNLSNKEATSSDKAPTLATSSAIITNVLNGNFFWMINGRDKIVMSEFVEKTLAKYESACGSTINAKKLDAVAAKVNNGNGRRCFVRALAVSIVGNNITLFGLDSGIVYEATKQDVFALPSSLNLIKVPALATLARLSGNLPTPRNSQTTELALGILCSILRKCHLPVMHIILESGVLRALACLINCREVEITNWVMTLVTTITQHRFKVVIKTPWYCFIPGILANLRMLLKSASSEKSNKSENCPNKEQHTDQLNVQKVKNGDKTHKYIETCLACLANCMYRSLRGKNVFARLGGLNTVFEAYCKFSDKKLCTKVLANYCHVYSEINGRTRRSVESSKKKTSKCDESDDGIFLDDSSSSLDNSGSVEHSLEGFDLSLSSQSSPSEENRRGRQDTRKFYVRGKKAPFSHDATHELLQTEKCSPQDLSAIICGMLNTGKECSVYMGIRGEDSTVHGVTLVHNARDEFSMALDELLMKKLIPRLLHIHFQIKFVPVAEMPTLDVLSERESNSTMHQNTEVDNKEDTSAPMFFLDHSYVIEIHLRPQRNAIYSCNGNECFYRVGGKTVFLDVQLLQQLLVLEEEVNQLGKIMNLEKELASLQAQVVCHDDDS